ncbi:MAG: DUF6146 family protein [Marinilabilia sp.]
MNFKTSLIKRLLTGKLIKTLVALFLVSGLIVSSCKTTKKAQAPEQEVELIENDTTENGDTTEYELIVIDPGFESWLVTQPPANYHSQQYYEIWNNQYVNEWNQRYNNPSRYGDFYQTKIQYDPHKDYGLELNYRLYYYFRFIEEEYGIVLIRRRGN